MEVGFERCAIKNGLWMEIGFERCAIKNGLWMEVLKDAQ